MYEAHLRSLLSPLGIYDLEEHSASGAAVCALGTGLDTVSRRLEEIEREALTATAEGEGLARREALFARRPAAVTTAAGASTHRARTDAVSSSTRGIPRSKN